MSKDTFDRWRKDEAVFAAAVKRAEAEAINRNVAIIQRAARKSWQAAAWWLERKYPEKWGRQLVEHVGESDRPPMVIVLSKPLGYDPLPPKDLPALQEGVFVPELPPKDLSWGPGERGA